MLRNTFFAPVFATVYVVITISDARADGGAVRWSRIVEDYRVTVFTSPTPWSAGPVDLSVMVQDARSGDSLAEIPVSIRLAHRDEPANVLQLDATREAATNKLLRSANFILPRAGTWQAELSIGNRSDGPQGSFAIEASEARLSWDAVWFWIVLPIVPITFYVIHEIRCHRRKVS